MFYHIKYISNVLHEMRSMEKIITIIWNMLISAYLKDIREIFIQGLQKENILYL